MLRTTTVHAVGHRNRYGQEHVAHDWPNRVISSERVACPYVRCCSDRHQFFWRWHLQLRVGGLNRSTQQFP